MNRGVHTCPACEGSSHIDGGWGFQVAIWIPILLGPVLWSMLLMWRAMKAPWIAWASMGLIIPWLAYACPALILRLGRLNVPRNR